MNHYIILLNVLFGDQSGNYGKTQNYIVVYVNNKLLV